MTTPATKPPENLVALDTAPGCVYALGMTYADHVRETGEQPGAPAVFIKRCQPLPSEQTHITPPSATALDAAIRALDPALADWLLSRLGALPVLLDYEVEVGIVLFEDVHLGQLDDVAFAPLMGYVLANDLTARSVQIAGEGAANKLDYWAAAKSFAHALPLGSPVWCPQTPDLQAMPDWTLQTRVNGELRQSASTTQLMYSPRELLRWAATCAPEGLLRAHNLVLTGTPAGVALSVPMWKRRLAALLPRRQRIALGIDSNRANPKFLQPGDVLEFSAQGLGQRRLVIGQP